MNLGFACHGRFDLYQGGWFWTGDFHVSGRYRLAGNGGADPGVFDGDIFGMGEGNQTG